MLHASYWNNVLYHSSVLTLHSKENYRQLQFPSNSCVRLNINYTSRAQHLIFLFLLPLAISRTVTSNSLLFKSVSVNRENLNFGSPGRQTKNYLKLFPDLLWGEQSFAYKVHCFTAQCPHSITGVHSSVSFIGIIIIPWIHYSGWWTTPCGYFFLRENHWTC